MDKKTSDYINGFNNGFKYASEIYLEMLNRDYMDKDKIKMFINMSMNDKELISKLILKK